jgi:hypothetical protein
MGTPSARGVPSWEIVRVIVLETTENQRVKKLKDFLWSELTEGKLWKK